MQLSNNSSKKKDSGNFLKSVNFHDLSLIIQSKHSCQIHNILSQVYVGEKNDHHIVRFCIDLWVLFQNYTNLRA